jgi:hypothetical protein
MTRNSLTDLLLGHDPEAACRNRERCKVDFGGQFYREQAYKAAQWEPGQPPPKGLILGSLPQGSLQVLKDAVCCGDGGKDD